ncbi:MAG: succinyl-diaminopimelate desuccinylase [Pseudomonadales bacterium]
MNDFNDVLNDEILELARKLISAKSISPKDEGCQQLIADYLAELGFEIEHLPFGNVENLWATRKGSKDEAPGFVFAGHTDVVPPGPLSDWETDPFEPVLIGDMLHGRGAADMKGSLAAMLTATKRFIGTHNNYKGTIGFLITSDEETEAKDGTVRVLEELAKRGAKIDWCIVGEPSSKNTLGDVVRVGRRGSLNANLKIIGQQGHVAYPDDASNPIHAAMQALADLANASWDEGNEYFPPTSMQISNIHSGTGVNNVIPGAMEVVFNFRFSTESSEDSLRSRTVEILEKYDLNYEIDWSLSGNPFMTVGGELIPAVQGSIQALLKVETELSTSGGTSDGRFIAPYGAQVVELGPRNKTIHKVNECVSVAELQQLSLLYTDILNRVLT